MEWVSGYNIDFDVGGVRLEGACYGPPPTEAPTLLLLHEGLGCVRLWRDFPQKLSEATGCGVFAYSRQGYGNSDPVTLPRPLNYMNIEAEAVVPVIIDQLGVNDVFLVGHSDGGSIAAAYAGIKEDPRLCGIVLMAPHFFAEDISVSAISEALEAYQSKGLREKLSKYHSDVDGAFHGWCDSWLNPAFRKWSIVDELKQIDVPVQFIQGDEDRYGTLAQLEALEGALSAPLTSKIYKECGHSPFSEKAAQSIADIAEFVENCRMQNNAYINAE